MRASHLGAIACAAVLATGWVRLAHGYEAVVMPTTHYHYDIGLAAIEEKDYARAIENLRLVLVDQPRNADALDWLGFAYAQSGERERALAHYRAALKADPRHQRAHQHLGEAHLAAGDKARARESLAALKRLCRVPCEALLALEQALAAAH